MKWRVGVGVMGMGGGMHLKQIRRYMVRDERWIARAGREVQDAIRNLRIQFRPYRLSSRAFLNANPIVISKPVVSRQLPERLATFFVAL